MYYCVAITLTSELAFAVHSQNTHRWRSQFCSALVWLKWLKSNATLALCEMYWVHLDRFEWSCDGYTLVEPKRITVAVCFIWVSSHVPHDCNGVWRKTNVLKLAICNMCSNSAAFTFCTRHCSSMWSAGSLAVILQPAFLPFFNEWLTRCNACALP